MQYKRKQHFNFLRTTDAKWPYTPFAVKVWLTTLTCSTHAHQWLGKTSFPASSDRGYTAYSRRACKSEIQKRAYLTGRLACLPDREASLIEKVHGLHCTHQLAQEVVPRASLHSEALSPECERECLETGDCGPYRHVGAGRWGLLGPTAHRLLGRRHPGPPKYRDSRIFAVEVRACAQVP